MPITAALISGGLGIAGGLLSSNTAANAARDSANATVRAANIAAEEARFRPVGVTTAFGSSNFGFDENGRLTSAGYNLTPEMAAMRDRIMGNLQERGLNIADMGYGAGKGLFDLGSGYLAKSPEEAASKWMADQQNLLAPYRERALSGVRNNLFTSGRGGLSVGATGARPDGSAGLGASNPEMEAYYNSLAQQDAELATRAQEQGRATTLFGNDLMNKGMSMFSTSYNPFTTMLGAAGSVEDMGMNALNVGASLGAKAAPGSSAASNALLRGGMDAASMMNSANSYNPVGAALTAAATNPALVRGVTNWWNTPGVTDGGYSVGTGAAYGGTYDSSGMFTPYRAGM